MTDSATSRWHGLDKHIFATLMHRLWTVFAGGITVLLIPLCYSSVEQGYYFAFYSILALQIFFELGMGQVVVQIVAHEAAHLRESINGVIDGDAEYISRLYFLRVQLQRWYFPLAIIFFITVSAAGIVFFYDRGLYWLHWAPAWVLLVAITAVNLNQSWRISMIEGFGLVENVSQLRLWQSVIGSSIFWCSLFAGGGLWCTVIIPITSAISTIIWLRAGKAAAIFRMEAIKPADRPISWMRDILPFQWRIAVSWISGYFIFQLFTPLIFRQAGAVEAGRLGLAITIFGSIGTIGLSWVNSKASMLSMMIARSESIALLKIFYSVAIRSLLATLMISALVIFIAWWATRYDLSIMHRIADLPILICLAVVTVVNCLISSAAIFIRSHREEPMLTNSVASAGLIAVASWYGSKYGTLEVMVCYATVICLIALPWTLLIFRTYVARYKQYVV